MWYWKSHNYQDPISFVSFMWLTGKDTLRDMACQEWNFDKQENTDLALGNMTVTYISRTSRKAKNLLQVDDKPEVALDCWLKAMFSIAAKTWLTVMDLLDRRNKLDFINKWRLSYFCPRLQFLLTGLAFMFILILIVAYCWHHHQSTIRLWTFKASFVVSHNCT